jgi:GNAT superfamily N-acetyltransferase
MEQTTDYSLETYGPADRNAFLAAFAGVDDDNDSGTTARRLWWAFDNPSGGAFFLDRFGRAIAATSYLGGKRVTVGGKMASGFEIGETATDPAHQRRGLFSQLVAESKLHATKLGRREIWAPLLAVDFGQAASICALQAPDRCISG